MKTDTIFYEIFKEFPNIFFELIGSSDTNPNTYQFLAPEIKQRTFRLDGVFSPLAEFHAQPLYFVEVQFYKDEEFYDRLFTSIFIVKLIVENSSKSGEVAQQLITQAREQLTDPIVQEKVLQFIETIIIYKFPNLSPKEIEAMLNLDIIRGTRVYREAKQEGREEGKLEIVPKLLQKGLSVQEIAELLELDVETVRKASQ
ncbi:MAG: Rpn family recombination-promoting nuclease/putative transposase [Crinalium sp.]